MTQELLKPGTFLQSLPIDLQVGVVFGLLEPYEQGPLGMVVVPSALAARRFVELGYDITIGSHYARSGYAGQNQLVRLASQKADGCGPWPDAGAVKLDRITPTTDAY